MFKKVRVKEPGSDFQAACVLYHKLTEIFVAQGINHEIVRRTNRYGQILKVYDLTSHAVWWRSYQFYEMDGTEKALGLPVSGDLLITL